jgi:urate oxidase
MATVVGRNRYGKEGVRLVRVRRSPHNGNTFDEWTVRILLEGDFASSYSDGDNSQLLPTDTMKNTGLLLLIIRLSVIDRNK